MSDTPETDAYNGTHETHRICGLTIYGHAREMENQRNLWRDKYENAQRLADISIKHRDLLMAERDEARILAEGMRNIVAAAANGKRPSFPSRFSWEDQ